MSQQSKKLSDFEKNRENPFLKKAVEEIESNIVKKYKTATKTDQSAILQAIDPISKEPIGHTQFIRQIEVDEDQFAKIYLQNFPQFFYLNPQAIRVFGYILTILMPNKDYVYFDREDCMKYTGYKSDKSVFLGIASLLQNEIIARGKNDITYYINPMIFFNGNRVTFTKTYIKKNRKTVEVPRGQTYLAFDSDGNHEIKEYDNQ